SWEFEVIRENMRDVICANMNYLLKIADSIAGRNVDTIEYKLARKDVFVKSGNLSAAFERMTSEPKSKQKNIKEIHKFVVLNHILSSYIATVAAELMGKTIQSSKPEISKSIKKSLAVLNDVSNKLGSAKIDLTPDKTNQVEIANKLPDLVPDNNLLSDQLGFINKITADIARVTENVLG
ncbi:MAG: FUSC family protein, partial [Mucilaginibacter sp.]